ncbi:hypothetical protein EBU95_02135 [bacterium]|nr:hypothetical protein [bacterium]
MNKHICKITHNMDMESYIPQHSVRSTIVKKFEALIGSTIGTHELYTRYQISSESILKMALNIERGIFNYALKNYVKTKPNETWNDKFKSVYMSRVSSIYVNLNPTSYVKNTLLLSRLLDGEIDEFELCNLDPPNMFPERWNDLLQKHKLLQDAIKPKDLEEIPDGIVKCGKCKSYKTEYVELQTRSSDEPTSKFCYCHKCGNRWKFY